MCVFTRKPKAWKNIITITTEGSAWEYKGIIKGKLYQASNNPGDFPKGTTMWIMAGPNHIHETLLEQIKPFVEKNSFVGTIFA